MLTSGEATPSTTLTLRAAAVGASAVLALMALAGAASAATMGASTALGAYDYEAPDWGLDFRHAGDPTNETTFAELMGSGACVLDYDGDGWEDIFLLNGKYHDEELQALYDPRSALYRNVDGAGFERVPGALEISAWGMGCAAGDYDRDGDADVAVTTWGGSMLYRNDGGGAFTNATAEAGIHHPECGGWLCFGASVAWIDYDKDSWLDLYVLNYLSWDGVGIASPNFYPAQCNVMWRNNRDGSFTNVSEETRTMDCGRNHLAMAIADVDGNGWQDIFIASDETLDTFLLNNGDGTFTERAFWSGIADPRGGMGAAWGDYDGDGKYDLVITHFLLERFALYRQGDGLYFTDRAGEDGLEVTRDYVGWGAEFADLDNDRDVDLIMANGHVSMAYGAQYGQLTHVMRNDGGRFVEVQNETYHPAPVKRVSRGLALADFDRDGYLDHVITNNPNESVEVYRSTRGPNNHLTLRLSGNATMDPHALGAVAEVTLDGATLTREVVASASYLSQSSRELHFGLGDAARVERLVVRWPDGTRQEFADLAANQHLRLTAGGPLTTFDERPVAKAPAPIVANRVDAVTLRGEVAHAPAAVAATSWTVDGVERTGDEVAVTFATLGTRDATYRVTDAAGRWDEAEVEVDVVNLLPVPVVEAEQPIPLGVPGVLVGSASSDRDGAVVNWTWLVEGRTYHGAEAAHLFSETGAVPVRLTVRDSDGGESTLETTVQVELSPPVAVVAPAHVADRVAPLVLDGSASSDPDGDVVSWRWDLPDGVVAEGRVVEHRFGALGRFTVTLTVTDDDGLTASTTTLVDVVNLPPVPRIDAHALANVGQSLPYDGAASADADGEVVRWEWSFGEAAAEGARVAHAFDAAGARVVRLTVTDSDGASASAEATVDVVTWLAVAVSTDRDVYGPLDRPVVTVDVRFANGLPAAGASVDVTASWVVTNVGPFRVNPVRELYAERVTGVADEDGRLVVSTGGPAAAGAYVGAPTSGPVGVEWGEHRVAAAASWRGNAGEAATAFRVRAPPPGVL